MAKKRKLKKFKLHPVTTYILLMIGIILLSSLLRAFNVSTTYSTINASTNTIEPTIVTIKSLLTYDGLKYMISSAAANFSSFTALSTLIITLIGISIAEVTGLIQVFMKKTLLKINPKVLTFLLFLVAILSSIVNEVGYALIIPLGALVFLFNGRNPLTGIAAAFAGVAFGYGVNFFVSALDINLISHTIRAASLIDSEYYVRMTANLFICIVTSLAFALVGTFITEKIIAKKLGRYISKTKDDLGETKEIEYLDLQYEEQKKIMEETNEKKGSKYALIAGLIMIIIFIYMIIPGLPFSGILLDLNEDVYSYQLFGDSSYFQDGFTYLISLFFLVTGIAYGIGAKTISNNKDLFKKVGEKLSLLGTLLITLFFASQFIAAFKESNLGLVIVGSLTNLLKTIPFSGIILIIVAIIIVGISNIFITSYQTKWTIISPVLVPVMMQNSLSPEFAQFIFRAASSITNGITPLLPFFIVYIGYLNIYNKDSDKSFSIREGISLMMPYLLGALIIYVIVILLWYIIGLPLGPGVFPTI